MYCQLPLLGTCIFRDLTVVINQADRSASGGGAECQTFWCCHCPMSRKTSNRIIKTCMIWRYPDRRTLLVWGGVSRQAGSIWINSSKKAGCLYVVTFGRPVSPCPRAKAVGRPMRGTKEMSDRLFTTGSWRGVENTETKITGAPELAIEALPNSRLSTRLQARQDVFLRALAVNN